MIILMKMEKLKIMLFIFLEYKSTWMDLTISNVKAIGYIYECYASTGDFIHGDSVLLKEFFIPEYNICFNVTDDFSSKCLNVFESSEARCKNTEFNVIYLPLNMVNELVEIHKTHQLLNNMKKNCMSNYQMSELVQDSLIKVVEKLQLEQTEVN